MNEISYMISSLISVLILWVMIFWFYRDYCVDSFRQKVFALRDQLFDDGMNGKFPFNHKSYGLLRITMNGSIRFAHKLNLGLLLLTLFSRDHSDDDLLFGRRVEASLEDLDDAHKAIFLDYLTKLRHLTLAHMLRSSPIIMATIILPIILNVILWVFLRQLIKSLAVPLKKIGAIVYAAGDDSAEMHGTV